MEELRAAVDGDRPGLTIVRRMVVTMALMGRANWWLPGWLDRLLPPVGMDRGDVRDDCIHGATGFGATDAQSVAPILQPADGRS